MTRSTAPEAGAGQAGRAVVQIVVPIPPYALSKNSRAHWRTKHRAFQDAKRTAYLLLREAMGPLPDWPGDCQVVMDIGWFYSHGGHIPDSDNAVARLAACRDAAQQVGLVANDASIEIGKVMYFRCEKGGEAVTVIFREAG